MKMPHTRYHWIMVALVVAAFLLTLSVAYGQSSGAAAVFEGRPAMAGAQGGQGAQAGMAQGGIGVQGADSAERGLHLRKPSGLQDMPQGKRDDSPDAAAANTDMTKRKDIVPARDPGLAQDERSVVKKTKRAAKRTISRARHGVAGIDSSTGAPAR